MGICSKPMLQGVAAVIALQLVVIVIAFFKGIHDAYIPLMAPVTLLCLAIIGIAIFTDGSISFALVWVVLAKLGVLLQVLLVPNVYPQMRVLLVLAFISIILTPMMLHYLEGIPQQRTKWVLIGCFGLIVICYVALALFGIRVGNIARWVNIGGMSIQITEIVRFVVLVMFALVLCDRTVACKTRYFKAMGIMIVCVLFFILVSELGTLMVLGITFVILCALFLPMKFTLINIGFMTAALLVGVLIFHMVLERNFLTDNALVLGSVNRVHSRVATFLDPSLDPWGYGFQSSQARLAIAVGGLTGSSISVNVPVLSSDFAFVGLLLHLGGITGLITIVLYSALLIEGVRITCSQKECSFKQVICAGFIWSTVVQAGLIIGGTTGFLPLTGIPLPFLSQGGTYLLITNAKMGYLLFASSNISIRYPTFGGRKYEKITRKHPIPATTNTH